MVIRLKEIGTKLVGKDITIRGIIIAAQDIPLNGFKYECNNCNKFFDSNKTKICKLCKSPKIINVGKMNNSHMRIVLSEYPRESSDSKEIHRENKEITAIATKDLVTNMGEEISGRVVDLSGTLNANFDKPTTMRTGSFEILAKKIEIVSI